MRPLTLGRLLEEVEEDGPDRVAGERADALAKIRQGMRSGDSRARAKAKHLKAMRNARNSFKYGGNTKDNRKGFQATVPKNIPDSARKATRDLKNESSQPADVKLKRRSKAKTLAAQRKKGINVNPYLPGDGVEARGPNQAAGVRAKLVRGLRKTIKTNKPDQDGTTPTQARQLTKDLKRDGMKNVTGIR